MPTTTWALPCERRANWTRPSPPTAGPLLSRLIIPKLTTTSASPYKTRVNWTRPSPPIIGPSNSSPALTESYSNLGVALYDTGQLDKAIAAYRQAIALNPAMPKPITTQAQPCRTWANWMRHCRLSSRRRPLSLTFPEAYNNLGNILKNTGQLDEAIAADCQAIAPRRPTDPEVQQQIFCLPSTTIPAPMLPPSPGNNGSGAGGTPSLCGSSFNLTPTTPLSALQIAASGSVMCRPISATISLAGTCCHCLPSTITDTLKSSAMPKSLIPMPSRSAFGRRRSIGATPSASPTRNSPPKSARTASTSSWI